MDATSQQTTVNLALLHKPEVVFENVPNPNPSYKLEQSVSVSGSASVQRPPPLKGGSDTSGSENQLQKQSPAALLADKFLILDPIDGSTLHRCVRIENEEELVCKIVPRACGDALMSTHFVLESLPHINYLQEVVIGSDHSYLLFPRSYGDLHSHVRARKRLREPEARRLFRQMATTVRDCHYRGVVLRDLKLRKFVFADEHRTHLKLESLEDAVVLPDPLRDMLQDKRGCPAYVSPEILRAHREYSGRAADAWSLGVILYTMLVGRYPFNDSEHVTLFAKISRGVFVVPDCLSSRARCLIRSLLRRDPQERLSAEEILEHPWLTKEDRQEVFHRSNSDHCVPDILYERY